jgi:hypothetical protein
MSHYVTHTEQRGARLKESSREGITVAVLRSFLADCDAANLPDDTRVHISEQVSAYSSDMDFELSASVRLPLVVP